jgi:prolipoprotein diacylglyceryl transferase
MLRTYAGYRSRVHPVAYLPSPSQSVWHLGPIPIRAYALCIVLGIIVALWLGTRRMRERGGTSEDLWDVAGWAIVLGIIGGRLYHVVTDPELYFKAGESPINALKIWDGGLGIWGAIALGAFGAWIGCRRHGLSFLVFADIVAPGIVLAQGIGRWGNWFNNELYGGPTSLPWGLQVHCLDITQGNAIPGGFASGGEHCAPGMTTLTQHYQPTFLYECLWDIALGLLLIYLDRRLRLGRGNVFALYVMGYTLGRVWIEALRTDHANHILGLRLNIWTSIIVFALATAWFVRHGGFHAVREAGPYSRPRQDEITEPGEPADPDAPAEEADEPGDGDAPGASTADDGKRADVGTDD